MVILSDRLPFSLDTTSHFLSNILHSFCGENPAILHSKVTADISDDVSSFHSPSDAITNMSSCCSVVCKMSGSALIPYFDRMM